MAHCLRMTVSIAMIVALGACGGAGNPLRFDAQTPFGPISDDEADRMAARYTAMRSNILAMPVSGSGSVPTSGQATFSGFVEMVVAPSVGSSTMTMVGDAVLNADFGGPFMTARMDNFAGDDMNGNAVRLDGELQMDDGRIGGASGGNIAGTFSGILLGDTMEIDTRGAFEGQMRGVPSDAVSFSGFDGNADVDGVTATVSLSGVAEE